MSALTKLDTTAIVLAGGMGTRLRSVVADLPKVLASVAYWEITDLQGTVLLTSAA